VSIPERAPHSRRKSLPVWIAPALSLLLLVAIAAFFFWYWWGRNALSSQTLSPEAIAAMSKTFPVPGMPAGNQGLLSRFASMFSGGGAVTRPASAGLTIPSLRVPPHGSIIQPRPGGPIFITAGPYTLVALADPGGGRSFGYQLHVRPEAAFSPDDVLVFRVASQIITTRIGREQSGAPPELIMNLRTQFGPQLRAPTLKIPDAQFEPLDRLWLQYVVAREAMRQDAAIKLLDALAALGPKALAANQQSLAALAASLEQVLPISQAQAYSQAMRAATRPSATQPAY
jgi:hypothetical protein